MILTVQQVFQKKESGQRVGWERGVGKATNKEVTVYTKRFET